MNLPLSTAFTVSHRFCVVVFSFSFFSMHILISFFISSVICWLFTSVLFSLLWRTMWRFLKKLELELPYNPAAPLLGIHTEETRTERDTCAPVSTAAVYNSQDMEATYISTSRWMDRKVLVHIHNGISLSHKKEHIWVSSNEVDEPRTYYTKWSKSEVQFRSVTQ